MIRDEVAEFVASLRARPAARRKRRPRTWAPSAAAWKWARSFTGARTKRARLALADLPEAVTHRGPEQVAKLRADLEQHPRDVAPLLVYQDVLGAWKLSDGNHRLAAARELGMTTAPVLVVFDEPKHGSKRVRPETARRELRAPNAAAPLCETGDCGFAAALAEQMWQSLLGNPHTVFVADGSNENTGARGYRYLRVRSQNADWFQEFDGDRKKLRRAIDAQRRGEALNLRQKEARWLAEQTARARTVGWSATFDGKAGPFGIEPEPPLKRAVFDAKPVRVYLALPEQVYGRMKLHVTAVHMSPNLWLNRVVEDKLEAIDDARAEELERLARGEEPPPF